MAHAPTTNRPTTIDDLASYEREDVRVLTRPNNPTPAQAKWFGNALAAAPAAGLIITHDMHIDRPKTEQEMEDDLRNAQICYDAGRKEYLEIMNGGEHPKWAHLLQRYCKAEGITPPVATEPEER